MLSRYERRVLESIEVELTREDPQLSARLSGEQRSRPTRLARRQWLVLIIVLLAVAIIVMVVGAAVGHPGATMAGATVAVVGGVITFISALSLVRRRWL